MKYILLTIISITLFSCNYQSEKTGSSGFSTKKIGACEYWQYESGIIGGNSYSYSITHKGDCPNPIHKCKCD